MKASQLNLALVTLDIEWENPSANRVKINRLLERLEQSQTDVVVLPEMFTTGFSMDAKAVAEPYHGKKSETIVWMADWARKLGTCICGSVAFQEGNSYYNRLIWMPPDGNFSVYDKRHLFTMAGEGEAYKSGGERLIVQYKGWKICPLICYDLRFPVWSRNVLVDDQPCYDLLIYVANWPTPRYNAWVALLQARAIENLSYSVGINRIGKDENGLEYKGGSLAWDFKGNEMHRSSALVDDIATIQLDWESLSQFRQKFPAFDDADDYVFISE